MTVPGAGFAERPGRSEHGSATVVTLVMLVVVGLAGALAADLGGLLVAKRRAASAADLAALAGATAVQHGRDGCSAVVTTAAANRARVASCRRDGEVVAVVVTVGVDSLPGLSQVHGRARAGPG